MREELTPEICVIGGGPGGMAAALAAAGEGVSVVLVEKGATGGTNLTSGAVPSKALLAAAAIHQSLRDGPAMGVTGAPLQVNLGKVREHIVAVGEAVARNVSPERLTALGVKIVAGEARFADRRTVVAGDVTIRARRFIVATGAVPASADLPGLDGIDAMTFAGAFELKGKPAHLLVLGAGRHALEVAQGYTRLGIDATVMSDSAPLPEDDPELAAIIVQALQGEGVRFRIGVRIEQVSRRRGGIRITVNDPTEGHIAIDGSHLLVATGRIPAVADLGLEAAGIAHDADGIVVDRWLRTSNRRVHAIGDVVKGPALATRAEHQAAEAVRAILFRWPFPRAADGVAAVTFTDPGLATVGLAESAAHHAKRDVRVLRFPFAENDRSQIERQPAGMIKVVASPGGTVLGAAIVGRDAGELIAPWALAVAQGTHVSAVARLAMPYPTRSDISRRVAAAFRPEGLTSPWRKRIIELLRKLG